MNEYPVFVTDEAQLEMKRISDYLKNVLCSEQANNNFLDELERQKAIIATLPEIYAISQIPEIRLADGRVAPVNNYVMVYTFDGDKVIILHIFHSLQDYGRLM